MVALDETILLLSREVHRTGSGSMSEGLSHKGIFEDMNIIAGADISPQANVVKV